jgi:hypothetical protein
VRGRTLTALLAVLIVVVGGITSAALAVAPKTRPPVVPPPASNEKLGATPKLDPDPDALGAVPVPKQRGVALGMFAEDIGFSYAPLLKEIAALQATHVALVVPIYQTHGRSTDLGLHTRFSPTLELVADTVRAARRERLEVTVFPIVRLLRPAPGEWRGTLAPDRPAEWFRRYGEILGDLGAVGAQTGASRLVVGSELSTLDGDLQRWRPLIERIRAVFPGTLVYSANWDHYREARLYELCDEDGVAAYFPLRDDARAPATVAALEAGWRRHKQAILAWRAGRPHPLVFTEIGYRSRAGASAAPWDESAGGTPDLDEQQRAFVAFRGVWAAAPELDGVYVWNWYGWGGPASVGYTPRSKPAAEEVKRLLQAL